MINIHDFMFVNKHDLQKTRPLFHKALLCKISIIGWVLGLEALSWKLPYGAGDNLLDLTEDSAEYS